MPIKFQWLACSPLKVKYKLTRRFRAYFTREISDRVCARSPGSTAWIGTVGPQLGVVCNLCFGRLWFCGRGRSSEVLSVAYSNELAFTVNDSKCFKCLYSHAPYSGWLTARWSRTGPRMHTASQCSFTASCSGRKLVRECIPPRQHTASLCYVLLNK